MKTKSFQLLALGGILLMAFSANLHAAAYTWNGLGTDSFWGNGGNWINGTAPTPTGHSLVFSGTTKLNAVNNNVVPANVVTSVNGLTFDATAGAFVLSGSALTVAGNIENASSHLQTIANTLSFSGTATINSGPAGITLSGGVLGSGTMTKLGAGTLTLSGPGSYAGMLTVNAGKLLLDVAAGGHIGTNVIRFGSTGGSATALNSSNAGGIFEVRGAASGTTTITSGSLSLVQTAGDAQIVVNANGGGGTVLSFSHLTRSTTGTSGQGTLNFDLTSSSSNKINVANILGTGISGISNGIVVYTTVTTSTNIGGVDVRRTGLAGVTGVSGNYELVRNVPTGSLAATGNSSSGNYVTEGVLTLTSGASINSLTITGGGSLNGITTNPFAVLMEEGVGNYAFNNSVLGRDNSSLFLHQYSTDGVLTINADLFRAAGSGGSTYFDNTRLIKAGGGSVVFNGSARSMIGSTDLQEGLFQLNGSLAATSNVFVRGGATLSGSGSIGGGGNAAGGGTTVYTRVAVYEGGTLNATHTTGDGLQIKGSLVLYEGSNFSLNLQQTPHNALKVTKDPGVSGSVVTLNGNLVLTLGYAPILNEEITLLTSDSGFGGTQFATINGNPFGEDSTFSLTYNSQQYVFSINYGATSVYLLTQSVIPEPGSVSLMIGAGLGALVLMRRRRFVG